MKILITGSSGFIGRNLKENLRGHKVLAPTHKKLDLEDELAVNRYFFENPVDIVINCASYGIYGIDAPDMVEKNLRMFFNLAFNSSLYQMMINIGSGAEYDKSRPLENVSEGEFDGHVPKDKYGFSKYVMAKYVEKSDKIIHLRPFGLFGKYEDSERRFISNAISRVLSGLPIIIYKDVKFDYLCVDDFVKVIECFIGRRPENKFYNIGSGVGVYLSAIARKIQRLASRKTGIKIIDKELGNEYTCNNKRLLDEIGNIEFTPIDEAIKNLYDWYNTRR